MKKLKKESAIKLDQYDVSVQPWLTYTQIQAIADKAKTVNGWAVKQQMIDMCLLTFACGIDVETVNKLSHNDCLQSGLIDAVKQNIRNLSQIEEAIAYEESWQKALSKISEFMPQYAELKEAQKCHKEETNKK